MSGTYDVIVIGAGITGASTAYHLKQKGVSRVLLIERDRPAAGGTGKSAAGIRQNYSTAVLINLARTSIEHFRNMPDELGMDGGYVAAGYHMIVPDHMLDGVKHNIAIQQSVGVTTGFMSEGEIGDRMPWLNRDGVAAVTFEPDGGYADPVRSTEAYVQAFQRDGGDVRLHTPVRALVRSGDRVDGVLTDYGVLAGAAVVNAAGPWAHFLARSAELELPLRTVREQDTIWEESADRPLPTANLALATDAMYFRPMSGGRYILGAGHPKEYFDVDPYNFKETADDEFVADLKSRLEIRMPHAAGSRLIEAYASLYDVTPDWYPFVGPRDGLTGYYDASGGSGHGFKIGPAIGRELAAWIVDGHTSDDFAQFSFDRLAAGNTFVQTFSGNRG